MKLILAIPIAGMLISEALNPETPYSSPLNKPAVAEVSTARASSGPGMWVENALIYKDESIQLHFQIPHEQYLGLIDPDGHFFYVVYPAESSAGKLRPFVSSEQFITLKVLTLNTSTFEADPYTYEIDENKPVFTKTGSYRFLLGDDLHTDDDSFTTVLKIKYRHIARPVQTVVVFPGKESGKVEN